MTVVRGDDFLSVRRKSRAIYVWSFVFITAGITILSFWINNRTLKLIAALLIISIIFDWGEVFLMNLITFNPNIFTFDRAADKLVVSHQKFIFTKKIIYPLSDIRFVKLVTVKDQLRNKEYFTEIEISNNRYRLPGESNDWKRTQDQALAVASFLGEIVSDVTRFKKEETTQ